MPRRVEITWRCDGEECVAGRPEYSVDLSGSDGSLTLEDLRLTAAANTPPGGWTSGGDGKVFCPWCKEVVRG